LRIKWQRLFPLRGFFGGVFFLFKYFINTDELEGKIMKFAIPLAEGKLTTHFGHCKEFAVIDVEDKQIVKKEILEPPPHEPGVLPKWLQELGANVIIAGGMGQRAISLFDQSGISVITGAPSLEPEELVKNYLNNTLVSGDNVCDH
jgi:predicted Fe-Mo cluster-binding NifX family protein